jgi:hypothetical protein
MSARPPLRVEIVAYAPTAFYHCTHCEVVWKETGFSRGLHAEQVSSALPPDLLADYQAVSDWVRHLLAAFGGQIHIRVTDAASLEGVWRSVRHGLRRYPAVLVGERRCAVDGTDFSTAETEIAGRLASVSP